MIRLVQYRSPTILDCGCLPAEVRICIPAVLASDSVVQDEVSGFLEATVTAFFGCSNTCGPQSCGKLYTYNISYDDIQLASYDEEIQAATIPLTCENITGVFCIDCQTRFLQTFDWWPGDSFYGNGLDGDITIAPSTTEDIQFPLRIYYYDNITIDELGTLRPTAYFINDGSGDPNEQGSVPLFVADTLTVNGHLSADGGNAVGVVPGPLYAIPNSIGGGNDSGGIGGNGADPNGAIPAGNGGNPGRYRVPFGGGGFMGGGLGGAGGAGGGLGGGTGYTPVEITDGFVWNRGRLIIFDVDAFIGFVLTVGGGSGGGGGGGGNATGTAIGGAGGAAGASGGSLYVYARHIVIGPNGSITANGGAGANGTDGLAGAPGDTADGGGGGGGGGGGIIYMIFDTLVNNGTIEALGGAGGSAGLGVAGGVNGSPGVAGDVGKIYLMNLQTGLFQNP